MKQLAAATLLLLAIASFLSLGLRSRPPAQPLIFQVAVWYGGGRARAAMLEPITADSRRAWRKDLLKIKALGFNTVRTLVEWAAAEPRHGESS